MADRDIWVRTFEAARSRYGSKARLRVSLIDPASPLAFCACALKLTTTGSGAEEVATAFGHSEVEALDALAVEIRSRDAEVGR